MKTQLATTIEQSNKLLELGIDKKTADMNWHDLPLSEIPPFLRAYSYVRENGATEGIAPAWSLEALLNLLPNYVLQDWPDGTVSIIFNYENKTHTLNEGTAFDACYNMLIWILENNYYE